MAARRSSIILTRHFSSLINYHLPQTLESLNPIISCYPPLPDPQLHLFQELKTPSLQWHGFSTLSRRRGVTSGKEDVYEEEDGDDDDEDDDEDFDDEEDEEENQPVWDVGEGNKKVKAFKAEEAVAIGYKVIGRLGPSDLPLKEREPIFAVVKIGSHQFKVSNEDCIYTERLKWCEVNDKLILSSVLMLGSETQTMIGRPTLPDAEVHAVVEEHVLDAKVIIFKKKRRKNYRRTKGHRQELTRLRITDIRGIEMPIAAAASS